MKFFVLPLLLAIALPPDRTRGMNHHHHKHELREGGDIEFGSFKDSKKKLENGVIEIHRHFFHKEGEEDNNVYDHKHYHVHRIKTVKIEKKVPEPYPVFKKVYVPMKKIVEKEVKVPVEKEVRVPYKIPYKIPVPVPIPKLYPIHIEKKVPIPVEVKVPYKVPVKVEVPKPYPVHFEKKVPVPYHVEKPVPYPVHYEKKIPIPIKVKIPYPVLVDKKVPLKIFDKKVPFYENDEKPYEVHENYPDFDEGTFDFGEYLKRNGRRYSKKAEYGESYY